MAVVFEAAGPENSSPEAEPNGPLLVINFDQELGFSTKCRRYCIDLYRAPSADVNFWNVILGSPSDDAEKIASVWNNWPRAIHGGISAAIAETQEKLESLGRQGDKFPILVIASMANLEKKSDGRRNGSDISTFMSGVSLHFKERAEQRRLVKFVLLLNSWDRDVDVEKLKELVDPYRDERFDAVVVIDRKHGGSTRSGNMPGEAAFIQDRIAFDLFLSGKFNKSFDQALKGVRERPDQIARRLLRLEMSRDDYGSIRYEGYANTILSSLEQVHKNKKEQDGSKFSEQIQRLTDGSH